MSEIADKVKSIVVDQFVPCIIYDPESKGEYENTLNEGLGISSLGATCIELLGFKAPAEYDKSVLKFK